MVQPKLAPLTIERLRALGRELLGAAVPRRRRGAVAQRRVGIADEGARRDVGTGPGALAVANNGAPPAARGFEARQRGDEAGIVGDDRQPRLERLLRVVQPPVT